MALLSIENLAVSFMTGRGEVHAVRDLSLAIEEGEIHAVVGESGCGKSVTSLAVMGLLPSNGKVVNGDITFEGESLLTMGEAEKRSLRGSSIAMIFQDPMTSLNPVYTCGDQVMESILLHQNVTKEEAKEKTIELFTQVKIPDPEKKLYAYPHELSGGMRQRVMIAMALACRPKLLIADEPTTALDVTVQAQILELLKDLQKEIGMAILFITHDLGVVSELADRVTVLYAGNVAESGSCDAIIAHPKHPYTKALIASVTSLSTKSKRLSTIDGIVPSGLTKGAGCLFADRCDAVIEKCRVEEPPQVVAGDSIYYCHWEDR